MEQLSTEEGLGLVMPALMVLYRVEHSRYPTVKEVREISASIADEMDRLGYKEFTPELLSAMVLKPLIPCTENPKLLKSTEINNFYRESYE